jgi:hypothetical protein
VEEDGKNDFSQRMTVAAARESARHLLRKWLVKADATEDQELDPVPGAADEELKAVPEAEVKDDQYSERKMELEEDQRPFFVPRGAVRTQSLSFPRCPCLVKSRNTHSRIAVVCVVDYAAFVARRCSRLCSRASQACRCNHGGSVLLHPIGGREIDQDL